ncbi:hypothetical protein Tco_0019600 [Tanacetum coccineum]
MLRLCHRMIAHSIASRNMALPPHDQRHQYLRYEGLQYTDADILDFESRLTKIYKREVHRLQVFNFGGLPDLMAEGLSARMHMEHRDAQGVSLFTSQVWRRLFDIRGPLIRISSARDFLGTTPSYTAIRDPILRLCHSLIACSIAGRSQAPEKVTVTDLFYLRGMDFGSVNDHYLLARLAEHFGLLTVEILQGLMVIAPELPIIDMAELVKLQICMEVDDTWAWVAIGPERQPDVAAPPPPPLAAAKTMPQRMARLEEDVQEIRGALAEQREVISAMTRDFSRFIIWAASGIAQLLDSARVSYTPYSETHTPYQHRVRQSTGEANTSTAQ